MKKEKFINFLVITGILLMSGCAPMPVMQLSHSPKDKGDNYLPLGKINVLKFEDNRPPEEKFSLKRKKASDGTFIYSGNTEPEMNEFLKTTIEKEITQSGLFTVEKNAEYELTGRLRSIKNAHKTGAAAQVGSVLGGIGFLFGVVGAIPGIVIIALNKDAVTSTVVYDVVLKKNESEIWQGQINVVLQEKYPTGFKGAKKRSKESGIMLDNAISHAVRKMIKQINDEAEL